MLASLAHSAGHMARMKVRPLLNAAYSKRRIRGHGHSVASSAAVLRRVTIDLRGTGHRVEIAPQARLSNVTIRMEGSNHALLIGAHVRIWSGVFAFYDSGCTVRIGDRTTIYGASFGATEGGVLAVGPDCLVSTEVDVRNGDSHSIIDPASGRRLNPAADVTVGNHVWLGARAMVLKGSQIGDHSVIGAGSIVTGVIPGGCVAAGVPARPVLEGTDWRRERI
jgi:acetyltransferase-like isoleucine patch superfamily enzyme